MAEYQILKVLNNNIILACLLSTSEEMVLVGKGIGFGQKENKVISIPNDKIQKSYKAYDSSTKDEYLRLIDYLDGEILGISEEIISRAEKKLGKLNSHIHIALTDHISFALDRLKMGMEINNPFLNEIKTLYSEEYSVALSSANFLTEKLGISIPEAEVGFMALHFHSSLQNKKVKDTVKNTRLLRESIDIIEADTGYDVTKDSLIYSRLVNHLKLAISRVENGKSFENVLLGTIKTKFRKSFETAKKVGKHLETSLSIEISEDELGYMALHIERVKNFMETSLLKDN